MKINFFFLLLLFSLNAWTQTKQKGLITELNSNNQPIAGVQLFFYNASPAISDTAGQFTLHLKSKKNGTMLVYQHIYKKEYEIVNQKELETSQVQKQSLKIVLCPIGKIAQLKTEYYDLISQTIEANYNSKINTLKNQVRQKKISRQTFIETRNQIKNEKENVEQNAQLIAEQFARTNFDELGHIAQQAFELFKTHHLNQALDLLNQNDWIAQAQKYLETKTQKNWFKRLFSSDNPDYDSTCDTLMKTIQLKINLYTLQLDASKTQELYHQFWQLDTSNLNHTSDYARFLSEHQQYQNALNLYNPLLKTKLKEWQKGLIYANKGFISEKMDSFDLALANYEKSKTIYTQLHQDQKYNLFYATHLGNLYAKFGELYESKENWAKALTYYTQESDLYRELCAANPKNESLKNNLAVSFRGLGYFHQKRGDLNKCLAYYILTAQLYKEIYEANPQGVDVKNDLAMIYQYLGTIYQQQENFSKALSYYTFSAILEKELYKAYPDNGNIKSNLATAYQYLGNSYQMQANFNKALEYFNLYHQLCKELYQEYPEYEDLKDGLAISYSKLGDVCQAQGKLDKALEYYTQNATLSQELYEQSPENETYTFSLATSYCLLGWVCERKKEMKNAKEYYLEALPILEILCKKMPAAQYKNQLKWVKEAVERIK